MNNFGEKVSFIWNVADLLRGPYRPNQVPGCNAADGGAEAAGLCAGADQGESTGQIGWSQRRFG